MSEKPYDCDVFIAGSGPIGCAFARTILTARPDAKVWMAEIGAQEHPVIGAHHKNSIKYQKDIDAFVHVIQGALQPISVPPRDSHMSTLGGVAWTPTFVPKNEQTPDFKKKVDQSKLTQSYHNPDQEAENNLIGSAITRTVGGMATHWTCACPLPHAEERKNVPYGTDEFDVKFDEAAFDALLKRSQDMLCVNETSFNDSIRHNIVLDTLVDAFGKDRVKSLPLAVKRRTDTNKDFVTWSGSDTILGDLATNKQSSEKGFKLLPETRVTRFNKNKNSDTIVSVTVRDLKLAKLEPGESGPERDSEIRARYYVAACGAVSTPQLLANSRVGSEKTLGHYLTEQSIAFCQIVLKRSIIEEVVAKHPEFAKRVERHQDKHKQDFLPIPFNDPEPQVTIPYHTDTPWHTQIHRDAFSYGDIGPRADPRVIVDLRFFGRQEIKYENCVTFARSLGINDDDDDTVIHDLYGMPQATFHVRRSAKDDADDHRMMLEMCKAANHLGAFLPGSYPQFMEPGLALHITGTTRLGNDPKDSVANANSRIHGYNNIWVGGNGCIPDSTACNPTLTSVAYAIKAAENIVSYLNKAKPAEK